jgi:Mrp family chromosome partitioning ATPase
MEPDGADLLAQRFADVIAEARGRFDVVVVDTPSLLASDDALAVAAAADAALLVVSAGSQAQAVDDALLAVESLDVPLLGVVGNRVSGG